MECLGISRLFYQNPRNSQYLHTTTLETADYFMPRALLPSQREHAEVALATSTSGAESIAQHVGCSTSQINKMRANLERLGSVVRPKLVAQGRPKKVTPAIETVGLVTS